MILAALRRTLQQAPDLQVWVGLRYHHANRMILVEGDPLPVRLRSSRPNQAAQ
jgi:hypothetical protein